MLQEEIIVDKKPVDKTIKGEVIDTAFLNVRKSKSLKSKILGVLEEGSLVEVDSTNKLDSSWLKLKSPFNGFVLSKYISIKE